VPVRLCLRGFGQEIELSVASGGEHEQVVRWVGTCILPHEPAVRAWLRRSMMSKEDIDDLIQEAYCKLSTLSTVAQISRPDRYFLRVVRNLRMDQLRRARIVRIDAVGYAEELAGADDSPSADRVVSAREELRRLQHLIDDLPPRCRQVILLRRVEGLSQKDIARRLQISESVVENEGVRGMRLIMRAMRERDDQEDDFKAAVHEHSRKR
jgi:RNA polymerase sigma factor (sigma-70 family)